jgi:hypothetical protein
VNRPLLVVDGDSFAHRAYHALPKSIRRKDYALVASGDRDAFQLRVRLKMKFAASMGHRHPRESGGPGQPLKFLPPLDSR